ncbi:MAG: BamA/TamA family outer membrane protein [Bacteroidia bacterium]
MYKPSSIAFISLLLLCLSSVTFAQSRISDWQHVKSERTEVHFQGGDDLMALRVAKYAERARAEVGRLYDFSPRKTYTLYYFPNTWAQQQALINVNNDDQSGNFRLLVPEASIVHPGTQADLYKEVKKVIARLVLEELSGGNRFFAKIQSHSLLYSLPWYSEGVTAYIGEGWDSEDEARLEYLLHRTVKSKRDGFEKNDSYDTDKLLDEAIEGNGELEALARKSIWQFVAAEYGEEKIAEIIYLADISNSLNIGTVSVLGITLPTVTTRWKAYCRELVKQNSQGAQKVPNIKSQFELAPIPEGMEVLGFDFEPRNERYALYLGDERLQQLFIWKKGEDYLEETPVATKAGPRAFPFTQQSKIPVAWSKDGSSVVAPRMQNGEYVLTYVNVDESELIDVPVQDDISSVLSLDWSHNGNLLLLSGLYRDRSAVFIGPPQAEEFRLVSRDAADYQDPVFSFDDQWVYFASNRNIDTIAWELEKDWTAYERKYDLWGLDRKEDSILRLTNTPDEDERNPQMVNSFELWYTTDFTGIPSVGRKNIILGQTAIMTDVTPGVFDFTLTEKRIVMLSALNGEIALGDIALSRLEAVPEPKLTLTRKAWVEQREKVRRKARPVVKARPQSLPDVVEPKEAQKPESQDSTKKKPAARYYIFDDDITPYEVSRKSKTASRKTKTPLIQKPLFPSLASISVGEVDATNNRWEAEHARLILDRDPLAGYRFGLGVHFADRFNRQSLDLEMSPIVGLYRNFKGNGGQGNVRYTRSNKVFDYSFEAGGKSYQYRKIDFTSDSIQFRYNRWHVGAGIKLFPLRNLSVDVQAKYLNISRIDLFSLDTQRPLQDASDRLGNVRIGFEYDNHKEVAGFPVSGWKIAANANAWQGFSEAKTSMQRIELDLRKYTSLPRNIVWAARIKGGMGLGDPNQRFFVGGTEGWLVPPLFLSREDVRESQDNNIPTGLYENHFAQTVGPVRGFWFFSRSGSKYFVMNQELRIPLRRLNSQTLPERNLYGISFVPFVDIGTAWTEGNPFSSRNKYPTETRVITNGPVTVELQTLKSPFILGFGGGFHIDILSYLVKLDVAWSVDDNTLQSPAIMISLGNRF